MNSRDKKLLAGSMLWAAFVVGFTIYCETIAQPTDFPWLLVVGLSGIVFVIIWYLCKLL